MYNKNCGPVINDHERVISVDIRNILKLYILYNRPTCIRELVI